MPRKQRTPLPLPERKALAIVARDALDAVIHQFHQASSGWESAAESSALGARQAMEAVSLLKSADRERDALAAANLAANKRIVELEYERDEERRKVDALLESSALLRDERDAARTELARLTTPRPIAEAPRDGTWVLLQWAHQGIWEVGYPDHGEFRGRHGLVLHSAHNPPSHFLPLPEVKP